MAIENAVLIDAVRTPAGRGKPGGALNDVHPVDLVATVLRALLLRNGLESTQIDDVLMGTVSQVGDQSMNIGRLAVLAAGYDETVPAATIDRQCGSSQQAVHFAAQGVMAGAYDIVVAAGVESMSRVPLGSAGHGWSRPSGIRERYPSGLVHQGVSAELIAHKWELQRRDLDEYAARSHARAAVAWHAEAFVSQVLPVKHGATEVVGDETIRVETTVEGLSALQPAFRTPENERRFPHLDWRITAGNSSPLTDLASGVLIMSERRAVELGLTPRARFHSFAVVGDDPTFMLTGPIPATRKVLHRSGLGIDDIDSFEVNEAFASVPLAWAKELHVDTERMNPWGGAIALGHAVGASGTRLLGNLVANLEATGGRYGLQAICEGGGMANAMVVERL